ncbi:MAG: hypothetical protein ACRDJN_14230 [Chloroflexota bacterium]
MSTIVSLSTVKIASSAAADAIALMAVLVFLVVLVQKEAVSAAAGGWTKALGRGLNLALVPLGLAFALIAAVKVLQVMP